MNSEAYRNDRSETNYIIYTTRFGEVQLTELTKLDMGASSSFQRGVVNSENSWFVSPNPNQGQFTIQSEKGGVFELMDITGKVPNTYTITGNNKQTINENLPAGMYFIRDKKYQSVVKLIVE